MGNCFSDPSKKGQRLGSGPPSTTANAPPASAGRPAAPPSSPPQALGGSSGSGSGDPRSAALAAAEARAKAASNRGVSASNPKSGQLSAKLQQQTKDAQQGNERMMDAGQWN